MKNEEMLWKSLTAAGMTEEGAAAMIGNLYAESGLEPKKVEKLCINRLKEAGLGEYTDASYTAAVDRGEITRERFLHPIDGKQYGYGLAQWTTEDRKGGLYNFLKKKGLSIGDLEGQIGYLIKELQLDFGAVWKVLTSSQDVCACSDFVLTRFEMPANYSQYLEQRREYSEGFLEKFTSKKVPEPGFDREKVIQIAKAEEGYIEKSKAWWKKRGAAGLYAPKEGAGSDNYTKYGYEMNKNFPETMDFPAPYCDAFVDWCFMRAYGTANAKKLLGGRFDDYTVASAQLYKDKKAWKEAGVIPEKGWQIFFKNSSRICHTGLVVDVVKDSSGGWWVITIEGNTSSESGVVANGGCVRTKQYRINYSGIAGYGVPPYGDAKAAEKVEFVPHWLHSSGRWYYRLGEGKNAHGWLLINSHWYFFDDHGAMLTGLQEVQSRFFVFATTAISEEFEGSCMRTAEDGTLRLWDVSEPEEG